MDKLPVGTRVVCPECATALGALNRELKKGDQITAALFDSLIPDHPIVDGEPAECPKCHVRLIRVGWGGVQLHTDLGWV